MLCFQSALTRSDASALRKRDPAAQQPLQTNPIVGDLIAKDTDRLKFMSWMHNKIAFDADQLTQLMDRYNAYVRNPSMEINPSDKYQDYENKVPKTPNVLQVLRRERLKACHSHKRSTTSVIQTGEPTDGGKED
jgi:hypothetical protein